MFELLPLDIVNEILNYFNNINELYYLRKINKSFVKYVKNILEYKDLNVILTKNMVRNYMCIKPNCFEIILINTFYDKIIFNHYNKVRTNGTYLLADAYSDDRYHQMATANNKYGYKDIP